MGSFNFYIGGKNTQKEKEKKNKIEHLMDSAAFKGLILAVIALYVIALLIQATAPGAISGFSNTTSLGGQTCGTYGNSSCYTSVWSSASQSGWQSLPSVYVVVVIVIFISIVVAVINML